MKATFFERLGAYFLDSLIIWIIFGVICLGVSGNETAIDKKMEALDNQLVANEITPEAYLDEYSDLVYEYQKEHIVELGVSIALTVAYYIVFQYMYKGQTLGKKALGIQVVDKKTEKPISITKGLLRSFLICNIPSSILSILLLFILKENKYFSTYSIIVIIEFIFILISAMFILYKKDGRGIHDLMANTIVVKERR